MGAELAVVVRQPSNYEELHHFNDVIVVKLDLPGDGGKWVLLARVVIYNVDNDWQKGNAKLVHDANVVVDHVDLWLPARCIAPCSLQAGFVASGREVITLECSTFDGRAEWGSIMAVKVDDIVF